MNAAAEPDLRPPLERGGDVPPVLVRLVDVVVGLDLLLIQREVHAHRLPDIRDDVDARNRDFELLENCKNRLWREREERLRRGDPAGISGRRR
jgi:hypothetical protein